MEHDSNLKVYKFEYEDDEDGSLIYEKSSEGEEAIKMTEYNGQKFLFANKEAMRLLGQICIQMAEGHYPDGYHLHIRENFNDSSNELICIGLDPELKV